MQGLGTKLVFSSIHAKELAEYFSIWHKNRDYPPLRKPLLVSPL